MAVIKPTVTTLKPAQQFFVKNRNTEFDETLTGGLVSDVRSRTDRQTDSCYLVGMRKGKKTRLLCQLDTSVNKMFV